MSGIFVILAVSSGGYRPSDNEGGGGGEGGLIRPRGGVGAPRWGGGGFAGPLPRIRHWFLSSSSAVFVCKTPVTNNSQKSMVHV